MGGDDDNEEDGDDDEHYYTEAISLDYRHVHKHLYNF